MNKAILSLVAACLPLSMFAQGTLSGDLQTNLNFFMKDEKIGAANNPLYDNALSGGEAWLSTRYSVNDWTFTMRVDAFQNSNLLNPTQALTSYGIGAYNITRQTEDLTISVGTIYDQIGSGILFRAYEDRGLLIDNALVGLSLKYKLNDHVTVKGLGGQQKFLFTRYSPVIKAANIEGDYSIGKANLTPGLGALNRTIDDESMSKIAASINNQDLSTRFYPRYNSYVMSAYNTVVWKDIRWYVEGAYKTHEAIPDTGIGSVKLVDKPGNVLYTTVDYSRKGFGLNLSLKRTENFFMRTSPNEVLLRGMMNWQPVVARQRPERVISRYTPASQDLSEMAGTIDGFWTPNEATNFVFTYTAIDKLDKTKLYRELFGEVLYEGLKPWKLHAGVQYMEYNTPVYRVDPKQAYLFALTGYVEITYLINDKKSLRGELQYMNTKQDFGSWAFALLEYNIAPKYSFSVSDMYNIDPNRSNPDVKGAFHYPTVFGAFTKDNHRFTLAYVKQVAGINCTGGVCRYEPAFSGVKATFATRF